MFNCCPGRDVGEGYTDVVNLHKYTKLTSLTVASLFLTAEDQSLSVLPNLPPNLEELQVEFDDTLWVDFYRDDDSVPTWLFEILLNKHQHMPDLQRVRIMAYRNDDDDDAVCETSSEAAGEKSPESRYCDRDTLVQYPCWRPPKRLMVAFDSARVCYSLYLNEFVRYKRTYAGVIDFEDHWEDSWVCSWA